MAGHVPDEVKVSVVVAVYNTGERIQRLLDSLLAQSMPLSDFEIVFVDDGSTDGSGDRLRAVARETAIPRMVVETIPNSGWPGRPRNIGLDLSHAEYVLFMDHDDELFPEALDRMYRYGVENAADVVIGKEVRAGAKTLGLGLFRRNIPDADLLRDGVLSLLTPHKMFRTAFLREHAIRFPEGRRRLEDHHHLAQVYTASPRISVLADYPCYRWIIHDDGSNNSAKAPDPDGYYGNVREVLDVLEAAVPPGRHRDSLLGHWYRGKTLDYLGPGVFGRWERPYQEEFFAVVRQLVADRFPERLDAELNPVLRIRARYVRAGDLEGLLRFAESERHVSAPVQSVVHRWEDGVLIVTATSRLESEGQPLRFRRDGDRVLRVPLVDLGTTVPDTDLDVTSSLPSMSTEMTMRQRASGAEWFLPATGRVELADDEDGSAYLVGTVTARIDPATAVFGTPLTPGVWDLHMRTVAVGYDSRPRLPAAADVRPALVDGLLVVPYPTRNGKYSLDVGQRVRTVVGSGQPTADDVRLTGHRTLGFRHGGRALRLQIDLPRVASRGERAVDGLVWMGELSHPATLEPGSPPRLRAQIAVPPGEHALEHEFCGRRGATGLRVVRVAGRGVSVSALPKSRPGAASGRPVSAVSARGLRSALKSVPGLRRAVRAARATRAGSKPPPDAVRASGHR